MRKPINIGGDLIISLEDQLTPKQAFCELIENSGAANATTIDIVCTRHMMSICDNGDGTHDPNFIGTPSKSTSRHVRSAIGSKGIGANQACATFGRTWDIQTVSRRHRVYHHYKMAWKENGPLPDQYQGAGQPTHDAPRAIRQGGTKITVTGRRDGSPYVRLDAICSQLEEIYRPYLHSGDIKITLHNPEILFKRQLRDIAYDHRLFAAPINEIQGTAAGHAFTVRYGALKEYNRVLSGCHLIFGPRVVKTLGVIGKYNLPSACYVDVIMSSDWKHTLSTNKNNLARYEDELMQALERLLGDWILKLKQESVSFKMNLLFGRVAATINRALLFLQEGQPGEYQKQEAPPVKTEIEGDDVSDDDDGIGLVEKPKRERRKRARPGGLQGAVREEQRRTTVINVVPDELLGHNLFGVSYADRTGEIEVKINVGKHQRLVAEFVKNERAVDIQNIAIIAFATYVAENRNKFAELFRRLKQLGYEDVDLGSYSSAVITQISNFLIDAAYDDRTFMKRKAA